MTNRPARRSVVVVGGGVTGLLTARRLAQQSFQVTLIEAADRVGGQVCTIDIEGRRIDIGAESLHLSSPAVRRLLSELDLGDSMVHAEPGTTWLWTGGALRPLPAGVGPSGPTRFGPVVTSGVMSVRGIGRAGLEPLAARLHARLREGDDISVGEFVSGRFGVEVAERLLDPLLGGLHAGDVHQLSLRACAPGLVDAASKRRSIIVGGWRKARSGPPTSMFATWPTGLATLTDRLLSDVPVRVLTGVTAAGLVPQATGYRVELDAGAPIEADSVVLAVPASAAASLVAPHSPASGQLLSGARVARVATVVLGFDRTDTRSLRAFAANGVLISSRSGLLLKALTNLSRKWAQFADDDLTLLRLSVGRAGSGRLDGLDDGELVDHLRRDLLKVTGLRATPRITHVHRWSGGLPQLSVGHRARLAALRESLARALPGVLVAGSSYDGLGVASCLAAAESTAAAVAARIPTLDGSNA
jgi:oxygen-dependent protoporphyrinogen oxidase